MRKHRRELSAEKWKAVPRESGKVLLKMINYLFFGLKGAEAKTLVGNGDELHVIRFESNGMLLAGDDGTNVKIIEADKSNPGDLVCPEGLDYDRTPEVTFEEFMQFEILTKKNHAYYDERVIRTDKELLTIDIKDKSRVR